MSEQSNVPDGAAVAGAARGSAHPLSLMNDIERIEMSLEWDAVVEEMSLHAALGAQGFEFSRKMFIEAYSRGYVKARDARLAPNGMDEGLRTPASEPTTKAL